MKRRSTPSAAEPDDIKAADIVEHVELLPGHVEDAQVMSAAAQARRRVIGVSLFAWAHGSRLAATSSAPGSASDKAEVHRPLGAPRRVIHSKMRHALER